MARSGGNSAGVVVAGLTAAALAVIGFFAFQASAAQDGATKRTPNASESSSPAKNPSDRPGSGRKAKNGKALPAGSGHGARVVYALERHRVWLVGKDGKVTRTYEVVPSTVDPEPKAYKVTSRSSHVTGSDGVPVENVVRFANAEGTTIGFSAAVDGKMPKPDASQKTGGIREKRADGEAMWLFATIGTNVVVVP